MVQQPTIYKSVDMSFRQKSTTESSLKGIYLLFKTVYMHVYVLNGNLTLVKQLVSLNKLDAT